MDGLTHVKRLLDISISSALIVILSPLLLVISLSIILTSPGPALFKQSRLGLNGKPFYILKFRTMIQNAEFMGTGLYSYLDDPRITKVGHFLRQKSLDELPQLFNVFNGSMSLVGPRPPVSYELGNFEDFTPVMLKRFTVKPGVTGLAQVSGRNGLDWDAKIHFDNLYVDCFAKYGLWLDFSILLRTIWVVLESADTIEFDKRPDSNLGQITAFAITSNNRSSSN
jgi:lipopolysaccharide/colanic/teichoic acid biosynthesis glycosyltransferase